jgi:hypothetical protein
LDNLRSIVTRSLRDVTAAGLSADARFIMAYDFAGGVSTTDADGLLKTVRQFAIDAETWVKAHHPGLA